MDEETRYFPFPLYISDSESLRNSGRKVRFSSSLTIVHCPFPPSSPLQRSNLTSFNHRSDDCFRCSPTISFVRLSLRKVLIAISSSICSKTLNRTAMSRIEYQKALHQKASTTSHLQGKDTRESDRMKGSFTAQKASKRSLKNEPSVAFQQPERSNLDSLPDSSASGNEYRALRRKYLLLEEESFTLGTELKEVEDEVKNLEEEKLGLLDELLVLEGLIDRSELQLAQSHLPQL